MGTPGLRKRVAVMTEAEKTRALLVDELTGLGSRRAWDDRDRMPVQAMLDIEGLKWINDNVGWPAGDELLRVVAAAIGRSLEEAASALRGAKQAGVVSGERAARGTRPLGLTEVSPARGFDRDQDPGLGARVARAFRSVARFLGRVDEPTYRFYLRALREADPAFGKEASPSESGMSLEWLVRDARRSGSEA